MSDITDLVFVAGASRSGTTLLARTLGLHDKLHTLGETHFFGEVTTLSPAESPVGHEKARHVLARLLSSQKKGVFERSITDEFYRMADEILQDRDSIAATALFETFARRMATENNKQIAVEQTPRNIFFAGELLTRYPNCRIIEIVRDPRAVLYSQRTRWRIRFSGGTNIPLLQSLRVFVAYHAITMSGLWTAAVKSGLKVKGHPRFISIRYEDLVNDPEASLRRLCAFLGVDFNEQMLAAPHATSSTRAANREARGFYRSSVNAWEDKLPRGDRALCNLIARTCAAEHGYELLDHRKYPFSMLLHVVRYPLHLLGTMVLNPKRLMVQLRSVLRFPARPGFEP